MVFGHISRIVGQLFKDCWATFQGLLGNFSMVFGHISRIVGQLFKDFEAIWGHRFRGLGNF